MQNRLGLADPNPNPNPNPNPSPRSLILDRVLADHPRPAADLRVPSKRHPVVRVGPEGFAQAAWRGAAELIWGDLPSP